jgi:CelD/BcsL family acetyltransferase involved in cellulose biosynthesis
VLSAGPAQRGRRGTAEKIWTVNRRAEPEPISRDPSALTPLRRTGTAGRLRPTDEELALEQVASVAEIGPAWEQLAERAGNPYATPLWVEAWLRHVSDAQQPSLWACVRGDGRVAAVLPLVVVRGRYVRRVRFVGFGAVAEAGPVCAPEDVEVAARAIPRILSLLRGWDAFLGEYLAGRGWADRIGGRLLGRLGSPVVRIEWSSWDEYLALRSANFRQELRRKERRLQARGFALKRVVCPEELPGALDALFALHRARWGARASPWFSGREQFHREFANLALQRGWLRLRLLELNGRTVGAYYGFRFGSAEWFHQLGRDPAETESVGLVLLAHSIREAIAEDAHEFRLGPGPHAYKLRFATHDPGLESVGIARTLRGRLALRRARS